MDSKDFEFDTVEEYIECLKNNPKDGEEIFLSSLNLVGDEIDAMYIKLFMDSGVIININELWLVAAEYRYDKILKALIEMGYDPNISINGFSVVEGILQGHSKLSEENVEEVEECIKIIEPKLTGRSIKNWIISDCCEFYIKESEYLRKFLTTS